jgi:hypothetical protein
MVVTAPYLQIPWKEIRVDHVLPCTRFEAYVMSVITDGSPTLASSKCEGGVAVGKPGKADGLFELYPADVSDAHYVVNYYGSCIRLVLCLHNQPSS